MYFQIPSFLLKKNYLKIALVIASFAGFVGSYKYFKYATPIINIDIPLTGSQAIEKANKIIALQETWHVANHMHAVTFEQATNVQNFVELECGGVQAFIEMIESKLYNPYQWRIRYFKELDPYELNLYLTPEGDPYAFTIALPETVFLPELTTAQARKIAQQEATEHWNINLNCYEEIESSQNILPNGRVDHTFVYKRKDVTLGIDGQYRLTITVAGNQVVTVKPHVHIPENFTKKFEAMRSANNVLASVMHIFVVVIYLIFGLLGAFYFLIKNNRLENRIPLIVAAIATLLAFISCGNQLPTLYIKYSTALSLNNYHFLLALSILKGCLGTFLSIFTLCSVAQGLDRWAFPDHVQFFKLLTKRGIRSKNFLTETACAYLMLGILLGFATLSYYFFIQYCHWWCPANILADPNILTHYAPWFTPFFRALQAGFTEEMLFRALPLAGLTILGRYFKKERMFLLGGMILQALLFAGAHVNYPQMPAYFRLIELLPISLFFGAIYIRFGLYPAILVHALYDLILMSICIFASHTISSIMQQLLLVGIIIFPLVVCAYFYCRLKMQPLESTMYNGAWEPQKIVGRNENSINEYQNYLPITPKSMRIWGLISIVSVFIIVLITSTYQNRFTRLTTSRKDAISQAKRYLATFTDTPVEEWSINATPCTISSDPYTPSAHTYAWQNGGSTIYKNLIGTYLSDSFWNVRCIRFSGTLEERIENYTIDLDTNGNIVRFNHQIPEDAQGIFLSKPEARGKALAGLKEIYDVSLEDIRELKVVEKELKNVKMLEFTFQDMRPTTQEMLPCDDDQAIITIGITGDQITHYERNLYIPEAWQRNEFERKTNLETYYVFAAGLLLFCLFIGCVHLINNYILVFDLRRLFQWISICSVCMLIASINKFPLYFMNFSAIKPFWHQMLMQSIGISLSILVIQIFVTSFASQFGTIIPLFTQSQTIKSISIQGFLLGSLTTATLAVGSFLVPHTINPDNVVYTEMLEPYGMYIPLIGHIVQMLLALFANCSMGIVLLNFGLTLQRKLFGSLFILISSIPISFHLVGKMGIESLPYLLLLTLLLTVLINLVLQATKVISPLVIIPAYLPVAGYQILKQIMLNPCSYAGVYGVCTLTILITTAYWWLIYLYKLDQKKQPSAKTAAM